MPSKLTHKDIEHLRKEYLGMFLDEERMNEDGYDDVMTSIGYVCLWTDGEVTAAYAGLLGTFHTDGHWGPNEDCDDGEGEE